MKLLSFRDCGPLTRDVAGSICLVSTSALGDFSLLVVYLPAGALFFDS